MLKFVPIYNVSARLKYDCVHQRSAQNAPSQQPPKFANFQAQ